MQATTHAELQPSKAAMYVRMSTDHQKYSTENQADAIREYAANRNLEIVAIYADEGRSGLSLRGRDALKRLIQDVEHGSVDFSIILVLDVTRWGRFQDSDESAYYEYICRRAGVNIEYVAEQFENDGSIGSNIFKTVKREMAGEYSRELSKKVFTGQCRLIELGFRHGGPAGFGLRRLLVDEHGTHKFLLNSGEQKSLQTDRVVLVPGPDNEVKIVRWIYLSFTKNGLSEKEIAIELNRREVKTDLGKAWSRSTIHQVLVNEKYIGNNVYNRTSNNSNIRRVVNAKEMWVRSDGAFEAIVSKRKFNLVQNVILVRNQKLSDDEMLEKLCSLHIRNGMLSGIIIDEQSDMPSSGAYQSRFGSLLRAYELVGFTPLRDYSYIEINKRLRQLHVETVARTIEEIRARGAKVEVDAESGLLSVNGEISVSIVIGRCVSMKSGAYPDNRSAGSV